MAIARIDVPARNIHKRTVTVTKFGAFTAQQWADAINEHLTKKQRIRVYREGPDPNVFSGDLLGFVSGVKVEGKKLVLQLDEQLPDLTAKVTLVPHGYQIDMYDDKGRLLGSECRDFGGDYPVKAMRDTIAGGFLHAMSKAEQVHRKTHPKKRGSRG